MLPSLGRLTPRHAADSGADGTTWPRSRQGATVSLTAASRRDTVERPLFSRPYD